MKHVLLMAATSLLLVACSGSKKEEPEVPFVPGTTEVGSVVSSKMGESMNYMVWLPGGYDPTKTYPFLYLLHGMWGDHTSWVTQGGANKMADLYMKSGGTPMVIIMPDAKDTFYVGNYESYLHEELMPEVEAKYHCNGKRAVAGLSMGGYGTLYHVLKYPQKFTYGYAMSPATDAEGSVKLIQAQASLSIFPEITIETGLSDLTISVKDVRAYVQALKDNGLNCKYIERSGGHDWAFWPVCLQKALVAVERSFQ